MKTKDKFYTAQFIMDEGREEGGVYHFRDEKSAIKFVEDKKDFVKWIEINTWGRKSLLKDNAEYWCIYESEFEN